MREGHKSVLDMAHLGTFEVQIFRLANPAKPRLVLDRLASVARRGWPHSPSCPLCRQTTETAHHLLATCLFPKRIWILVADWLAIPELKPTAWPPTATGLEWWSHITSMAESLCKAIRSLTLLIMWENWKERNSRVFNHQESSTISVFAKIKDEASSWSLPGGG